MLLSWSNKSFVDLKVHFLLFPSAFDRHLRRNIDNKSSMNPSVYFLLVPQAFNAYQDEYEHKTLYGCPGLFLSLSSCFWQICGKGYNKALNESPLPFPEAWKRDLSCSKDTAPWGTIPTFFASHQRRPFMCRFAFSIPLGPWGPVQCLGNAGILAAPLAVPAWSFLLIL